VNGVALSDGVTTLETGVAVVGQQVAIAQLRRIVSGNDVPSCTPFMIYGGVGFGKTYLLNASAQALRNKRHLFVNGAEIRRGLYGEQRVAFVSRLSEVDVVFIDDVDALSSCDDIGDECAALIDRCISRGVRVIGASRCALRSCDTVSARLKERLTEGVVTTLREADLNERCALVRYFADRHELASDVIDWLSTRAVGNLRRLRACVLQLVSVQVQSCSQVDVARARVVLEEAGLLVAGASTQQDGEPSTDGYHASGVFATADDVSARKSRFKQMLTEAETDDEKRLALEIALGERLREFRVANVTDERRQRFERALGLLRSGNLTEALQYIA
jgi:chromosomal replication initiator protein